MTGPEHYREAEQLANQAHHYTYGDGADVAVGQAFATEALVHATLAAAAATALPAIDQGGQTAQEWRALIVPPRAEAVSS